MERQSMVNLRKRAMMNENKAKAFMRGLKRLDSIIIYKQRQLEELRTQAEKITAEMNPDRVQTSNANSRESLLTKIADLDVEIERDIKFYCIEQRQAMGLIDSLEDSDHIEILTKRYLERKDWGNIAVGMGYEVRQVYRKHGRALQELNKLLERCQ